ncbi:MAG TPA: NADH-quinone oxidoreductase subunit A [Candidatus Angelobacter sp.]|nr:NADH-quinone oxidoreductase subunit A [Candidatus Angelobacter sp.]
MKQHFTADEALTPLECAIKFECLAYGRRALYIGSMMLDNYFVRYIPLLIQVLVAIVLATVMIVLSHLLGKHRWTAAKHTPYECGINPTGDAQQRFSVKFYLVAMLFILFDIEAVFLYPWAVVARKLAMFGFWEMLVYIGLVLVGFFYIWKKGILDWNKPERSEG